MTSEAGEADERLREASDPTTPGERLRELWSGTLARQGRAFTHADRLALLAIMCNPALPLDLLRDLLRMSGGDAWFNPLVPALLLSEPSVEYQKIARHMLARIGTEENCIAEEQLRLVAARVELTQDLADAVALWATVPESKAPKASGFARHLAGLFSLPWPEP